MKWENKKSGFLEVLLSPLAASLAQPVIFSVVKGITGIIVRRTGDIDKKF